MRIDAIVFDCVDASPLARFWAAALEWKVAPYDEEELERLAAKGIYDPEEDPSVMVEPSDEEDLPALFFHEVPEAKAVKNRLHLDLIADASLEKEVERLESLGASVRNWTEQEGSIWCEMLDPEGNEFCIMPAETESPAANSKETDI